MRLRTIVAALSLVVAPGLAFAQGCASERMTQTSSQCQVGQTWDAATQACVTPVNS